MLAVVIHQFGDPKLLKVEEVSTPQPSDDDVMVVMHGTTLPRIPGRDFAGVIVGGPPDFIGREVWGTGGDIGFTRDGSHAEYILLPRTAVALKPAPLSMDAAATAGLV